MCRKEWPQWNMQYAEYGAHSLFYISENASEGDPAVTGRVMDFHETKLFCTVCYLKHVKCTQFSH